MDYHIKLLFYVTDMQCDQIWRTFATVGKVFKYLVFMVYFLIVKMLSLLWQIRDIIGQIFIGANGQTLKNNLIIW